MLSVASCYGNRDKLRPDGPLGPSTDFTFTFLSSSSPSSLKSLLCMPSAVNMRPFESTPGGGDALRPLMSTHLQVASATKLIGTRPTECTVRFSFLLV